MSVIILLVLVSTSVAALFLLVFFWAVRSGQYEDTDSPAVRMLYEEQVRQKKQKRATHNLSSPAQFDP